MMLPPMYEADGVLDELQAWFLVRAGGDGGTGARAHRRRSGAEPMPSTSTRSGSDRKSVQSPVSNLFMADYRDAFNGL